jgi:hypothetical protein
VRLYEAERFAIQLQAIRLFAEFTATGEFDKAEEAALMAFVVVYPPPGPPPDEQPGGIR